MILLIAVPAAVALVILAKPILLSLFYYGEVITARDMNMAALSLRAYAIGLVAFMLIKVLAPGYFARQDTRTPVKIGVIALVSNMGLNLVFAVPLHLYWGIGHVGLALATSVSAMLNAGLLLRGLRKLDVYQPEAGWYRFVGNLLVATLAADPPAVGIHPLSSGLVYMAMVATCWLVGLDLLQWGSGLRSELADRGITPIPPASQITMPEPACPTS
ncbi:MAG: lipid II flippase MurJ [Porticoccaceae bacterium]